MRYVGVAIPALPVNRVSSVVSTLRAVGQVCTFVALALQVPAAYAISHFQSYPYNLGAPFLLTLESEDGTRACEEDLRAGKGRLRPLKG